MKNFCYQISMAIQLMNDNQKINVLVKNTHIHKHSKHIEITYHHIKNFAQNNFIEINYIQNTNIIIDDLIKSLSKN